MLCQIFEHQTAQMEFLTIMPTTVNVAVAEAEAANLISFKLLSQVAPP
jgi:hypothetical protein